MLFRATPLPGVFVVDIESHADERGFFARTWCSREFETHGLPTEFVQASVSRNRKRGTLRGMHLQLPPSKEGKLIRCTRGAIYDVAVDLRPDSATFMRAFGVELSADACNALYIPPTMAHGFQTLVDDTDVHYQMTDFYAPDSGFGFRWNDPAFSIEWPLRENLTLLDRDVAYPDFDKQAYVEKLSRSARMSNERRHG